METDAQLGTNLQYGIVNGGFWGGKGPTSKLQDIKLFIQKKKPHVFGIIESDIYSPKSTNRRINRFTTAEVKSYLNIDGYTLELPDT